MKLSSAGARVLAEREGRRLKAYADDQGVWTIGVGHTSAAGPPRVVAGMSISEDEADAIFARDVASYEKVVSRSVNIPLAQHEFDALVSFCYNIGPAGLRRSSTVRLLNAGDRKRAADAFLLWNKPAAILSRRRGERAQFLGFGYAARLRPDEQPKNAALAESKQSPALPAPMPSRATAAAFGSAAASWWRRLFGRAA